MPLQIALGNMRQAMKHLREAQTAETVTGAHISASRSETELNKAINCVADLLDMVHGKREIGSKDA